MLKNLYVIAFILMLSFPLFAQEQSRESEAVDPTASQWSLQLAYEAQLDYQDVETRGEGPKGFFQFRFVAPLPADETFPLTLLPRLTARLVQNSQDQFGFGQSDLFILGILGQWATGRWGLGPQINFPAQTGFGSPNWGYGFAGAVTQRALEDDLFLSLLLQQIWRDDGTGVVRASPLGISLTFVYQLGKGWYFGNGDFVISYSWQNQSWFVPFGVRIGKAFINPKGTWNTYIEYRTWAIDNNWVGPVADHNIRVNVQYQIPVSL